MRKHQNLPKEFSFAGFSFPKYCFTLPEGSFKKRIEHMKNPVTGGYYHAPTPNQNNGTSFYLDSDFMPRLRWNWCDDVSRMITNTGWFCDVFGDQTIRGIVFRLPHNRGFLAGWSMGERMASELDYHIYDDEIDAAYAADSMAQHAAERNKEYQESEEQEQE